MKKSKFTDAQIVFAIKQFETGTRVDEISRQMGISQATFFNWKKKHGSMGVSELRKLRQLEEGNQQLKKLVADLSLDKQMLQDVIKKVIKPTYKKEMALWMVDQYQISQTRACKCVLLARLCSFISWDNRTNISFFVVLKLTPSVKANQ
jgi:putative transposase